MCNFVELRESKKFTQVSLANASGVPVRTIRALEQHQRLFSKLNLEYATSLSKCLGIRAEDLLRFDQ